jgi:DNA-directed RNA polymerase specialized sigma subunit
MHTPEQLQEMLAEHHEWQGKINFYRTEIQRMKDELADTITNEKNQYNMAQVEHYQNQFILQRDQLDILRHDFKQHENAIESHHSQPLTNLAAMHLSEREKLMVFERFFKELRTSFHGFIHREAFS